VLTVPILMSMCCAAEAAGYLSPVSIVAGSDGNVLYVAEADADRIAVFDVGCGNCHTSPLYTNMGKYDVDTGTEREYDVGFDTPTLVEIWRTGPYLHDGRAATIKEVVTKYNKDDRHGKTSSLSEREIHDLAEYVLTL